MYCTVKAAPSGEKAAEVYPAGSAIIMAHFNAETYATGGVELTVAAVNEGLASASCALSASAITSVVTGHDANDATYYATWAASSGKVSVFAKADETEASGGALDVEFPMFVSISF